MKFVFALTILILTFSAKSQDIRRYSMYSDHFDIEKYVMQYERKFDSIGIIKQKGQYHALTISLFGIMCFDEFNRTGDSTYYNHVVNQFKYFRDSSNLHVRFNGKGIGLPYKFNFHDLNAPWYSGLTQGIATSFLLRYWLLTNDSYALDLAKKTNYFMIQPIEAGGTLAKTSEGYSWIEEYPGTKRSKHVLNGFINGLVGLNEYCELLPDDTLACRVHDEVYSSLVQMLPKFDREEDWTSYDRNGKKISVAYLRIQLTQMEQLYAMYKDDIFKKQMMIWSMMLNNQQDKELKFYKKPDFVYGKSVYRDKGQKTYSIDLSEIPDSLMYSSKNISVSNKQYTYHEFVNSETFKQILNVIVPVPQSEIELSVSKCPKKMEIIGYDEYGNELEQLAYTLVDDKLKITSDALISHYYIKSKSLFARKFTVDTILFFNYHSLHVPRFAFHKTQYKIRMQKDSLYQINLTNEGASNLTLFYKYAKSEGLLRKSNYRWDINIVNFHEYFTAPEDGYYEFFISYQITKPQSYISELIIEEVK